MYRQLALPHPCAITSSLPCSTLAFRGGLGNTNLPVRAAASLARISSVRLLSGMRCSLPTFIRDAGITQRPVSRSISSHFSAERLTSACRRQNAKFRFHGAMASRLPQVSDEERHFDIGQRRMMTTREPLPSKACSSRTLRLLRHAAASRQTSGLSFWPRPTRARSAHEGGSPFRTWFPRSAQDRRRRKGRFDAINWLISHIGWQCAALPLAYRCGDVFCSWKPLSMLSISSSAN